VDRVPLRIVQVGLDQLGDFLVSLQQFERRPILGIWLWNAADDERFNLFHHLPVIRPNLRPLGSIGLGVVYQFVNGRNQLLGTDVLGGRHRHHPSAHRSLEDFRLNTVAFLRGDVHHIEGHNDR